MRTRTLSIVALATLLFVSSARLPAPPTATAVDHGPLFFGAYSKPLDGKSPRQAVEDLEAATGRQMDTVREYLVWNESFPTSYHEWLADSGRVPIISLKAKRLNGTRILWSTIAGATPGSETHNEIVAWAHRFRDYEAPFYFAFHHEPEISENDPYGSDSQYKAAWRKVVDIFRAEGVDNARYTFITTAWNYHVDPAGRRFVPKWYPGDDYVDFIGADAYNWGNCLDPNNGNWRSLEEVIEPFRQWGAAEHPDKPLMLAEWGTVEHATDPSAKAQWFADARELFKESQYSQFVGITYFNSPWMGDCTWHVDTTPQSLAAFSAMGTDPFYQAGVEPGEIEVSVSVSASPEHVVGPGDEVAFTVTITNRSLRNNAWINGLDAGPFGDVRAHGSCSLPKTIQPAASYACTFTGLIAGDPGEVVTTTVTASGWSNGSQISAAGTADVAVEAGTSGEVLLVVGDAGNLTASETAMRARLIDLDYSPITQTAATAAPEDATGKAAILISSSVRLSSIATKFTHVPEPVVVWKPWLYDRLGLTTGHGSTRNVTTVTVTDPAHPLAAGFSSTVAILAPSALVAVGTPAPSAAVVATAAQQPSLFVYVDGDQLADGTTASGCRIAYPAFHYAAADYTASGWALFENAVAWAAAGCPISPAAPKALFVVPNQTNLTSGDGAISDRLEGLGFTVVPRSAATTTAGDAAGIDLVLISSNVGESAVGAKFADVPQPVIIWKPWLYDAMRMSHSNGSNRTVLALDITAGDHPTARGFAGEATILQTPSKVAVGTPAAGATVIARAAGKPTLFAFSPGDPLADGKEAPGCRIAYPSFHTTPSAYTTTGWQLFDNTVAWATAGCAAAP
jgi:hypothetical protein